MSLADSKNMHTTIDSYLMGYYTCVKQMSQILKNSDIDGDVREMLSNGLSSCFQMLLTELRYNMDDVDNYLGKSTVSKFFSDLKINNLSYRNPMQNLLPVLRSDPERQKGNSSSFDLSTNMQQNFSCEKSKSPRVHCQKKINSDNIKWCSDHAVDKTVSPIAPASFNVCNAIETNDTTVFHDPLGSHFCFKETTPKTSEAESAGINVRFTERHNSDMIWKPWWLVDDVLID